MRLRVDEAEPALHLAPPSRHLAIHVSPLGPARRISVPLPYRAPRWVRATAVRFASGAAMRCTTLVGSRVNSGQLTPTRKETKSAYLQRKCGKSGPSEKRCAPICGQAVGVRVPSLTPRKSAANPPLLRFYAFTLLRIFAFSAFSLFVTAGSAGGLRIPA
jgi:hypothetical protein